MMKRRLGWLAKVVCVWLFAYTAPLTAQEERWQDSQDDFREDLPENSQKNPQQAPEKKRYLFGTLELPVGGYELSQFKRYVGETQIPLKDLISRLLLTLTTNTPLAESHEKYLAETYEIRKVRHLVSVKASHTYLFERAAKQPTPENLLDIVNRLHADKDAPMVIGVSPVFRFSDEPQYLTGKIIIQWGAQIAKERAEVLVKSIQLSVDSFDEKTHVMIVSPTEESGYNVFALADIFSPRQGNMYAASVEPQFAAITAPVRVSASLVAGDGKGYGSNIAGSLFRYALTVQARKGATVKINELRETSSALKQWLPTKESDDGKPKPVSPQVFVLEGSAAIREVPSRENIREYEIVYAFRMHEAGSFQLAPPPVLYAVADTQRGTPMVEEVQGDPIELLVGSVLPDEATMVNSPTGIPSLTLTNPSPKADTWFEKASWSFRVVWVLGGIAALLLGIAFFPKIGRREIPRTAQALAAWRTHALAIVKLEPEAHEQFWKDADVALRETLGILAAGDSGRFKAAQNPEAIVAGLSGTSFFTADVLQELSELLRVAYLHRFGGATEQIGEDHQQFVLRARIVFETLGGRHARRF